MAKPQEKTKALAKYGSYTLDEAEKEAHELEQEGGGFLKLKVGQNVVRFLPPLTGRKLFVVVHQHHVEKPGEGKTFSFACPKVMLKKPCALCDKGNELRATGNRVDYDLGGRMLPRRRVFSNVIDMSNPEAGPQILAFGRQIHEQLVQIRRNETAGDDYTDPENGFNISIERKGTGIRDTKYTCLPSRKTSKLTNMDWIEMQHDLTRFTMVPTSEEIKKYMSETDFGADEESAVSSARDVTPPARQRNAADDMEDYGD
jgi:hypothetical protein